MSAESIPAGEDTQLVATLLAVNPTGLGGVSLRALSGPDRDGFLEAVRAMYPDAAPWIKVPVTVGMDRLLGGLDFAATIAAGKPVFATGLLEAADGGVVILAMAERLEDNAAAVVTQAIDRGEIRIERDGLGETRATRFLTIALDEGLEPDEVIDPALADRLAFHLSAEQLAAARGELLAACADDIQSARRLLERVVIPDSIINQLVQVAFAFGIGSVRAELFAVEAARTAAAIAGRLEVNEEDAAIAARLVYSTRATRMPAEPPPDSPQPEEQPPEESEEPPSSKSGDTLPEDVLVDAVQAALPDGLLEMLANQGGPRRAASGGRSNNRTKSRRRGRPVGTRPSTDLAGSRLNLLATLKAAAPWQTLRRIDDRQGGGDGRRLHLRKEDLQVTRFEDNVETTTIFVVDASGSQAAQRLAEVKGAIELLLADCYVRRDQVALIAFRGETAETLLPPTRALARVKRSLQALPGGGGTPLALALDAARELAASVGRQGRVPAIVLMTDGRANVSRDGSQGADAANEDATKAANLLRAEGLRSLLVDTSRRPRPRARMLANAMGADYIALPFADAQSISATVQREVA